MDIKPIRNDEDYRATLREIELLMTAGPGTPEGERLEGIPAECLIKPPGESEAA